MLIPPSADSGTASEPATVLPNAAEEAALQQLQHQLRALRAMLDGNITNNQEPTPNGDERADSVRHSLSGADIFGMYSGRREERTIEMNMPKCILDNYTTSPTYDYHPAGVQRLTIALRPHLNLWQLCKGNPNQTKS